MDVATNSHFTADVGTPAADPVTFPRPILWQLAALVVLSAAGIAVFANGFKAPFVFDSEALLVDNPAVEEVWHWCSPWSIGKLQGGNRPIGFLSFALSYAISGFDAWAFHAANLAIHVAAAWLLFDIVRRTLLRAPLAARYAAHASVLALAIALLWLIHPLQTQSVTYIYQRLEAQAGLFYLATLWFFLRAVDSPKPTRWFVCSVICCLLGAGTKEVLATAPLVVLWYDRAFVATSWREIVSKRAGYYLAIASVWVVLPLLMYARWADFRRGDVLIVKNISPLDYALTQPGVILHYLGLAAWPQELCLDYGWPVARDWHKIAPGCMILGGLAMFVVWCAYRARGLGFLGGWFFLTLAPSSSFAPVADLAVEHRMYLPLAAVVALAVLAGWSAVRNRPLAVRLLAVVMLMAAIATLGWRSIVRNEDYRSVRAIWEVTMQQHPNFARPYNALAHVTLAEGQPEQALELLNRAIKINPEYVDAYNERGNLQQDRGELQKALDDYKIATAINPQFFAPYNNRGNVLSKLGRYSEAVEEFSKAIERRDDSADAYNGRGAAYHRLGQFELALKDFDRAIVLRPDLAGAYANRALVYGDMRQLESALQD